MRLLKKIVRFFVYERNFANKEINDNLRTLSPTDDGKNIDTYLSSLEWALYNSKSIKNIAISGPYGSGKSTIIDTYIKKHKSNHKYLKISLATFKDFNVYRNDSSNNVNPKLDEMDKKEIERLIELSLLQQLFYHEKDSKIPDSNFKKIRKRKSLNIAIYTLLTMIFIVSYTCSFQENIVSTFIKQLMPFYNFMEKIVHLTPWLSIIFNIYITSFIFFCLYLIIKGISRISKIKVSAQHAEIEIGKDINKSALNIHLDEILYFFEVSKYEVVFIEDLDRFGQSEIFIKLREINQLINNSNKIKQDVVFVYAIRDDVFMNKDRTKFFDFIIPVVPVINYSNSGDIL